MIEIKWHDIDPEMGEKRYISAERFAGVWTFKFKFKKRGEWTKGLVADRVMWLHVLDSLKRRYQRREGVDEKDIKLVENILLKHPPEVAS
jgi:hypothetical protein